MEHQVFISRVHKQSPYNVQAYAVVESEDREDVIDKAEVQQMIAESKGKILIVTVHTPGVTSFLEYNLIVTRKRQ